MPRQARKYSESGFYHVVLKGSASQIIFEDDEDRRKFLAYLIDMFTRHHVEFIAWCLMSNHVHLLVSDGSGGLSDCIHDLAASYAVYFNRRHGRSGAVFDGRFHSVGIESDEQLLCAVRYIHDNPAKAAISSADEYRWSSYAAYASGASSFTNIDPVLDMLQGHSNFIQFSRDSRYGNYVFREARRLSDEDALVVAFNLIGIPPGEVKAKPKALRNQYLQTLRSGGLSISQMARLTGVGRNTISRNTHE